MAVIAKMADPIFFFILLLLSLHYLVCVIQAPFSSHNAYRDRSCDDPGGESFPAENHRSDDPCEEEYHPQNPQSDDFLFLHHPFLPLSGKVIRTEYIQDSVDQVDDESYRPSDDSDDFFHLVTPFLIYFLLIAFLHTLLAQTGALR